MINFMGRNNQALSPSPIIKTNPSSIIPIQQRDAIRIFYDNLNNFPTYPSDTFTEKTQSFYPTCDLPKHTNEDAWNTKESMNLMFNISLPKSYKGITVNVNTARLRLYKQFVSCYSQSSNGTDDSQQCQPPLFVETMKQPNTNLSTAGVVPIIVDETQIRVSIYMYTRSLKRKRGYKNIISNYIYIYVFTRIKLIFVCQILLFTIKNMFNISTSRYRYMPCIRCSFNLNSKLLKRNKISLTPKPVPSFLVEAMHNGYGVPVRNPTNNTNAADALALSFNMHLYPILDVTTVEVPDSEANNALLYQYTKNAFEQVGGKGVDTAPYLPPGQEAQAAELQHRIRHGSRQHRNNGTVPGSLSRDGHELRDQIIPQGIVQRNLQYKSTTTEIPD
ncbi:hypothetical protein ACI65C_008745 [Semiaphis heraclei]